MKETKKTPKKRLTLYRRYVALLKRINDIVSMKNMIKSALGALLITLIIVLIPILVLVNMFIYAKLTLLIACLLVVVVLVGVFLYFHFYYELLKNYHEKLEEVNYRIPQYVESTLVALILLMVGILVIFTILF